MLNQIRSHITKKNDKLFYIFVFFVVVFGISIIHYISLEKDTVLSLKQNDVSSTYYTKYQYLSKNVNNITFYFQYEKNDEIIQDILGSYEINNHFDIKNIFKGFNSDEGKITLKLIDEDTCIYLDCSSNMNVSKPETISKINLLENKKFSDYKYHFISEKRLKDKNVYTLMEGKSLKDDEKVKLYLTYE